VFCRIQDSLSICPNIYSYVYKINFVPRVSVHAPHATTITTALLFTKIACVRHAPIPCRVCNRDPAPLLYIRPLNIIYHILIYIQDRRRVSRLRNFLLTGTLPYTGFTFDSPERQSYIIYQSIQYLILRSALYVLQMTIQIQSVP
jgi:hypothetical protein